MQAKQAQCMLAKYEKICGGLLASTAFELFDKMILPIVTYGAEIWVFQKYKQVEDVHYRYCKIVFGLPVHAANMAV